MAGNADSAGHRKRLRERFLNAGGDALADYELLELMLFQVHARRDTKPLAKALIKRFGSFAHVMAATQVELESVEGVGEAAVVVIQTVQVAARRMIKKEVMEKSVTPLSNWQRLMDYCHMSMARDKIESFRVLYLNNQNQLMADDKQQTGTVNHTPVYPREVVKRGLELQATAMIMVHNHPSGDPTPSEADIAMTREVRDAGEKMGITLHDHVIISKTGNTSFKSSGLI